VISTVVGSQQPEFSHSMHCAWADTDNDSMFSSRFRSDNLGQNICHTIYDTDFPS